MRPALVALALMAGLAAAGRAGGEPAATLADGRSGRIEFRSVTPEGPGPLVQRQWPPEGTVVAGDLALPPGGPGRVAAVVIAHGSGGVQPGREAAWARRLEAAGLATFVIDSFGPRGIRSTALDQGRLSTMANLADALHGLALLATHPRIDPARIAVLGFSRGGQVALYSALEPFRRSVVPGHLRFAAHVALYPSCSIPYRARQLTGAPVLMLLAGADDYTPPGPCRDYADWFRARGVPVRVAEYAGAHHGFDLPGPPRFVAGLETVRGCRAEADLDAGVLRRLDTGQELRGPAAAAYLRGCRQRGATFGGDPEARARAEQEVAAFLAAVLGR